MRLLGIDYGTKRIGLATSDAEGRVAFPHSIIENGALHAIKKIVSECDIKMIVLGDPRNIKGGENPLHKKVLEFKSVLEKELEMEVILQDETFTTAEVRRSELPPPHDARAAALILQNYIDAHQACYNCVNGHEAF